MADSLILREAAGESLSPVPSGTATARRLQQPIPSNQPGAVYYGAWAGWTTGNAPEESVYQSFRENNYGNVLQWWCSHGQPTTSQFFTSYYGDTDDVAYDTDFWLNNGPDLSNDDPTAGVWSWRHHNNALPYGTSHPRSDDPSYYYSPDKADYQDSYAQYFIKNPTSFAAACATYSIEDLTVSYSFLRNQLALLMPYHVFSPAAHPPFRFTQQCPPNTFYSARMTANSNRVCTPCSQGVYSWDTSVYGFGFSDTATPSTYWAYNSTGFNVLRPILTGCPKQSALCPAGSFYSAAGTPGSADRTCTVCSQYCDAGTYCTAAGTRQTTPSAIDTPVSTGTCTAQTTSCPPGTYYSAPAPGNSTSDRTCTPCLQSDDDPGGSSLGATDSTYGISLPGGCDTAVPVSPTPTPSPSPSPSPLTVSAALAELSVCAPPRSRRPRGSSPPSLSFV